ncbi:ANKL1 protein, partial [Centropus unirufus]|nr:ANKL1 protein [Centropus unirufus]
PEPGDARRSLSFLSEDISGIPEDGAELGPLSSTRRSLLEEPDLGGDPDLGDPLPWRGCAPQPVSLSIASCSPWPHTDRGVPAVPLASSTLLLPGDELREGSPGSMGSSGSSSTILLVPGDHGHLQGSPSDVGVSLGSSPTVLLVPGDHGHPQGSPSNPGGSPGSSPTIQQVLEDHGHPQNPPSDVEGSSGSNPTIQQVLEDHGSPVLPPSRSAHRAGHQGQDEERGQVPTRRHSPGTEGTTSPEDIVVQEKPPRPLSDEALRRRLRALGDAPGPITDLTRRLPELVAALRSGRIPNCAQDEQVLAQEFDHPNPNRHWREGLVKSSFNYLLLDPRTTQNLPLRSHHLSSAECFRTFIKAIFYVGKGTRARPYRHLTEALSQHRAGTQKGCPKVKRILEIWASGQGVISVHCFQNTVPAEAYTREGCLLEALGER